MGALLTVLIYFFVTAYGTYKILRVVEKKNYNLMQSTEKGEFSIMYDQYDRFTAEDGFKLTFFVKDGDGLGAEIPPEIGSISTSVWEWGNLNWETWWDYVLPIENHKCSEYELGLSDEGEGA